MLFLGTFLFRLFKIILYDLTNQITLKLRLKNILLNILNETYFYRR
jgi:hypothetical protein